LNGIIVLGLGGYKKFSFISRHFPFKFVGGYILVDCASGFLHVEHKVGFSAVETFRAKQNYESICMEHENVVQNYMSDNYVFKAKALSRGSINNNKNCVFVVLMHIIRIVLQIMLFNQFLILQERCCYMPLCTGSIMWSQISGL